MITQINAISAKMILSSKDVDVADYAGRYKNLQERLGIDFDHVLLSMRYVPPCVPIARHSDVRTKIAEIIGGRMSEIKSELPEIVGRSLSCLRHEGEHDLLKDGVVPLVRELLGKLAGISLIPQREGSLVSYLFSQTLGVARRKRMEDEYRELWAAIASAFPDESEGRRGARLALVILGFDATIGTVGCSLRDLMCEEPALMSTLPFEKSPAITGVPYVDRAATAAFSLNGQQFRSGEALRVNLESGAEVPDKSVPALLFGAGPHSCLGRSLTLGLWSAISREIRATPGSISVVDFGLSKNDVFRIPDKFIVRVSM